MTEGEMKYISLVFITLLSLFAAVLIISVLEDSPKFGTAVCKEEHHSIGVCSRFGCTGSGTDYYLIDANGIMLEVTKEVYDTLTLSGCDGDAQQ